MNLVNYLEKYKDVSFKECPFNEVDALIFSLMGYFPFYLMDKKRITSQMVLNFLSTYDPPVKSERKLNDIKILTTLCTCQRFKGIKFYDFARKRSNLSVEQFQAVTISVHDFIYVSYCGTDATTLGWREDFNMAFLDIVPSEIDAVEYINMERKKHPFKKVYIGGHSKGGRLAIRAGKEVYKKNTLKAVFSFDGPNFPESFYDEEYDKMKHLIYEFAPNESVIGRLMADHPKIIIQSSAKLLYQHDGYTWQVEDDHFVHLESYSQKSDKIAKVTKGLFTDIDNETKSVFVNTLFDILEKLKIEELRDEEHSLQLVKNLLSTVRIEWKNTPKEHRRILLKVLFTTLLILVKR